MIFIKAKIRYESSKTNDHATRIIKATFNPYRGSSNQSFWEQWKETEMNLQIISYSDFPIIHLIMALNDLMALQVHVWRLGYGKDILIEHLFAGQRRQWQFDIFHIGTWSMTTHWMSIMQREEMYPPLCVTKTIDVPLPPSTSLHLISDSLAKFNGAVWKAAKNGRKMGAIWQTWWLFVPVGFVVPLLGHNGKQRQ